jgi:hypothetical protein
MRTGVHPFFVAFIALTLVSPADARTQFRGLVQTWGNPFSSDPLLTSSLAEMTNIAPVAGTVRPLGRKMLNLAFDGSGSFFGCDDRGALFRINPLTGATTELALFGPSHENGQAAAIAYDAARDRFVIHARKGSAAPVYAMDVVSLQLTLLINPVTPIPLTRLQSMVYRPADDRIYGLDLSVGGAFSPIRRLVQHNASGEVTGAVILDRFIEGHYDGMPMYQIMLTDDDRIAVLTPPVRDIVTYLPGLGPRLYIIDPATGHVTQDTRYPVPEPATAVTVVLGVLLVALRRPRICIRG